MLANANQVKDLVIRATDGEIGTVDQLYFDDETWAIRYLTAATGGWLSDREVLISPFSVTNVDWQGKRLDVSPSWIQKVSWTESKVCVGLWRDAIKSAPAFAESAPLTREYEDRLHTHYGRPLQDAEHKVAFSSPW